MGRSVVDEGPEPFVRGLLACSERGADDGPGVPGRARIGDGPAEVLLCRGEGTGGGDDRADVAGVAEVELGGVEAVQPLLGGLGLLGLVGGGGGGLVRVWGIVIT